MIEGPKPSDTAISQPLELAVEQPNPSQPFIELVVNRGGGKLILLPHTIDDRGGTEGSGALISSAILYAAESLKVEAQSKDPLSFSRPISPADAGFEPRGSMEYCFPEIIQYGVAAADRFYSAAKEALANGSKIISCGGNHSRAVELLGFLKLCKELGRKPVIFWIDAHLDLQNPKDSETKNFHGMVAALLMGLDKVDEKLGLSLQPLLDIVGSTGFVDPKDFAFFGVNAVDHAEFDALQLLTDVTVIPIPALQLGYSVESYIEKVREICDRLGPDMLAAIEGDLDVLNAGAMMSNPKPLDWNSLHTVVSAIVHIVGDRLVSLGLSEMDPASAHRTDTLSHCTQLALAMAGINNTDIASHNQSKGAASLDQTNPVPELMGTLVAPQKRKLSWLAAATSTVAASVVGVAVGLRAVRDEDPLVTKPERPVSSEVESPNPAGDAQYCSTRVPSWATFKPINVSPESLVDVGNLKQIVNQWRDATGNLEASVAAYWLHSLTSYCFILDQSNLGRVYRDYLRAELTEDEQATFLRQYTADQKDWESETHYIRDHLAFMKHPIAGDRILFP